MRILSINAIKRVVSKIFFRSSGEYWESRYANKGNSGSGSYGDLAKFKADVINGFVKENKIQSVVDFGCGDGYQLSLFKFPKYTTYIGLDISITAVDMCQERFTDDNTKIFYCYDPMFGPISHLTAEPIAELALSLDVIFHLVEDNVFEQYMKDLFSASGKFVIIYSSNYDGRQRFHERPRLFTKWIRDNLPEWKMIKGIFNKYPEKSKSDFFIYKKEGQ